MKEELKNYRLYLEEMELSQSTIQTYIRNAENFVHFTTGQTITKETVLSYRKSLIMKNYKASTINLNIISVNKFLRFCKRNDCIVRVKKQQYTQSLRNVLEQTDYHALLGCASKNHQEKYFLIMKTLAKTGIRISELRYITVEAIRNGTAQVYNKGKYRDIYIPKTLAEPLQKYCSDRLIQTGSVFLGSRGTPISRTAVWKNLKHIAAMAGIDSSKVYPHNFRHFFALSYMDRYGNIFELADILGHSNVEITRIYSKSTAEQKRNRLDILGE